jgi:hypothetical protein
MAQTLISSTQFVVDPLGGKAKTSWALVTRVIKGVFPVYLVTMGVGVIDSTFSAYRVCICFLRGEIRNLRVAGHPMWGVVLTLAHNWANMGGYLLYVVGALRRLDTTP